MPNIKTEIETIIANIDNSLADGAAALAAGEHGNLGDAIVAARSFVGDLRSVWSSVVPLEHDAVQWVGDAVDSIIGDFHDFVHTHFHHVDTLPATVPASASTPEAVSPTSTVVPEIPAPLVTVDTPTEPQPVPPPPSTA